MSGLRAILISLAVAALGTTGIIAQEATCPVAFEAALDASDEACSATGRNQACYGHVAVEASPGPDAPEFTFTRVGDIVNVAAINTMRLSPLDAATGAWGVALMRLQANLPDTLPGQNVSVLVFGDTEIVNATSGAEPLATAEPDATQYRPMQAFYLRTGIAQPSCADAPPDGILVQTPEGAATVTLAINQVEVAFGSTLYIRAQPEGDMTLSVLEGAARAEAQGVSRPAVAGGRIRIGMDEDLEPDSPPGDFEPYDAAFLAPLPVEHLERPVSIAPSVTQAQADALMRHEAFFNQIDVDDFDALFAFLNENPDADEVDVQGFLQTQGYSVPIG